MSQRSFRDHPRSRGEYPLSGLGWWSMRGSSPLSRGILIPRAVLAHHIRIIPALAGNTSSSTAPSVTKRDHPRSRGEYLSLTGTFGEGVGIIPALAGNTPTKARMPSIIPDHPRSRGEYVDPGVQGVDHGGSSPLSRGIHPPLPAPTTPVPDHPRSRGEYAGPSPPTLTAVGSSPLSRGIRRRHHHHPGRSRIIPALAGNT